MSFDIDKKRVLSDLELCIREGLVDKEIIPILEKINKLDNYYTTSSCIGRIGLMVIPKDKNPKIYSKWLIKKHDYPTFEEIKNSITDFDGYLIFIMNSPILHIACRDIESAKKLLDLAIHSGLKASSIKSVSKRRVIVEILTTFKVDAPIGEDNKVFVSDEYLKFLLNYSIKKLKLAREKLFKFYDNLK
ncbi:tRNA(Phe) 7-((3-amino-3-carboxypropyl)-4-demethylwyosine(37)-N(4))-methyltransferase Taw3 [Methanocaldococcus indicus]|uniref:tRNA(Phe) 7-((3-amino-3-carboxypropyl)-4-demethylwyosine(37)-N(4))- methyltransferase Taw3 n=1 Tax=Methanocaldococcus indicus TaxID=213231 RepID=UPI003C6D9532